MSKTTQWTTLGIVGAAIGLCGCTTTSAATGQGEDSNSAESQAGAGGATSGNAAETGGTGPNSTGGAKEGGPSAVGGALETTTGIEGGAPAAGADSGGDALDPGPGGARNVPSDGGVGGVPAGGGSATGGAGLVETGGADGMSETGGAPATAGVGAGGGDGLVQTGGAPGSAGAAAGGGGGLVQTGGAPATAGAAAGGGGGLVETGGTGGASEAGGTAGTGGSDTAAVRGRVIDFWGHGLAGVPVDVDGTLTTTDANGDFEVDNVSPRYDASLVVNFGTSRTESYGWVYQGLTRRDPTLQVYSGLEARSGRFVITPQDGTFADNRTLSVAFGGPDGASDHEDVGELGINSSVPWRGPEQTMMTAHGLLWQFDETAGLPTSYHAYDLVSVALDVAAPAPFELDLTEEDITAGNIQGTVVPVTSNERENMAFVRFDTGAPIEVARDSAGPDSFTYLVPSLPNASATVAASEGRSYYSPFSLAHADGLAAGAAVELALPAAATPLLPADRATGVTAETPFSFQSSGGAHLVVIRSNSYYTALYIVTADQQFTLPTVAQGAYELYADELFEWWVETHGTQATVDEMADPEGFLDAFSWNTSYPVGPRRGDGEYTMSRPRSVTTAP